MRRDCQIPPSVMCVGGVGLVPLVVLRVLLGFLVAGDAWQEGDVLGEVAWKELSQVRTLRGSTQMDPVCLA
jgi:hypothetical protein